MKEWLYVMLIKKTKEYRRLNKARVTEHIENLRKLDEEGTIELAGAFKGYPGMAGMFIGMATLFLTKIIRCCECCGVMAPIAL
ncbi:hypothetical protein SSU93_13925, partial [Enterococcus avium]|nr:hypothetical protein [Enterococcus avium]MDY6447909.1 hypothetical protein [Enterococcus avium]MDY6454368.1 hypothetical protein [Enterococcus avium]